MKRVLVSALVCASLTTPIAHATVFDLLVGTYTKANSEGIYRYRFDSQSGLIEHKTQQIIKGANPSWLALTQDQKRLFVVNENGPGQRDPVGKVSGYNLDARTHLATLINQQPSQGDEPTHLSLSADERFVFVSNYATRPEPGGSLSVLPVGSDGRLGAVQQQLRHTPSGVNPERQVSAHVHSVVVSPDGHYVFASDLGADKVFTYRYDPASSTPLSPGSPAALELPPGSGPRHLLFSGDGEHAYLTLEMSAQVMAFDYRSGELTPIQHVELAGKPAAQNAGGALHLSADGRFLYVSNRGTANQLVVYQVDADGRLKELQRRAVEGDHPREFAIDPSGRFVLIANQMSNQIVVLKRDPDTGLLGETVQKYPMDSPADLKFLRNG